MKKREKNPISLKWGLSLATIICWVLPIVIVTATAALFLNYYYNTTIRKTADAGADNALRQVELRLSAAIEDSKAVSYEGYVRQAYREYQRDKSKSTLYKTTTDYLSQKYSRNAAFSVIYISFLDEALDIHPYAAAQGTAKYNVLRNYKESVLPEVERAIGDIDTGIKFITVDGGLYMVRNLLDNDFNPYAMLVMGLEKSMIFQSLYGINGIYAQEVSIDGLPVALEEGEMPEGLNPSVMRYEAEAEGHELIFTAQTANVSIWNTIPLLRWAILIIALLVLPLLAAMIYFFHRNINHPMEVLIEATGRVQGGERGYLIDERASNAEFKQLYSHFNSMSTELKNQFDRLFYEQQALQQAKIKALQSQINPHFLNNTLEIINWEARLADDERVCSMIEALSTMLDAAIGRDGRSEIALREELEYVDAYLYITRERLGDKLTVERRVEPAMLDCSIPRLMLQPIIENAVEHDLSKNGGLLSLRTYIKAEKLYFEVEHDGAISSEGWESIKASLAAPNVAEIPPMRGSVGLRNVNQRLKLMYGEDYTFTITQPTDGRILAQIVLNCTNIATNGKKTQAGQLTENEK